MFHFQVVNLGHLEITQLNLEGHKPEKNAYLESLCYSLKEMKEMILMMIMRYTSGFKYCLCMSNLHVYSRLKPVLVICWKIEHMMMLMMMTQKLMLISCFAYNNVLYVFKLPEGPISSHIPKRTADDTISTSSIASEYKRL